MKVEIIADTKCEDQRNLTILITSKDIPKNLLIAFNNIGGFTITPDEDFQKLLVTANAQKWDLFKYCHCPKWIFGVECYSEKEIIKHVESEGYHDVEIDPQGNCLYYIEDNTEPHLISKCTPTLTELEVFAENIHDAIQDSTPTTVKKLEKHLPYALELMTGQHDKEIHRLIGEPTGFFEGDEYYYIDQAKEQISIARCLTHNGSLDFKQALDFYRKLEINAECNQSNIISHVVDYK